jgi:gluconolactonase
VRRRFHFAILMCAVGACSRENAAPSPADASGGDAAGDAFDRVEVGGSAKDAVGVDVASVDVASVDVGGEAPTAADGRAAGPEDGSSRDGSDTGAPAARTLGDLYCPPAVTPFPNPLVPHQLPELVPISPPGGIMFLEGPVWLAERGVLLLSEWNAGHRILQLTPPQSIEVFLPASRSNGLALAPDGKALLMVTELPTPSVSRVSLADKSVQPLVHGYEGTDFVQPNDLVVRADGTIFFTDYQAGRLYRRAVDGVLSLISSLPHSNGVGLSPDEKTLVLNADTHTVRYPIAADGAVGAGTDLATGLSGADGLAIDCAGNVYIAQNSGGSLVVVSPTGTKLGEIGGLPTTVTNAAFGGADRRTLYITTSTGLYAIKLQIAGLPY